MCKRRLFLTVAYAFAGFAWCQTLPPGVAKKAAIGGVTEYEYPNGLRVLLFPDPASPKVTVNMTYLVGSRFEGYGETGMAHLLEHMNFIETNSGRQIKKELVNRGASWNGTTSEDRTNYFETVPATDDNLKWALGLEADRMVNMRMAKELLDTEMTVVRNEFERGENNPRSVLGERVEATAYLWHNYGKSTIGSREDIERVPIERLAAFYKKYYQPDNAVLVIAGRIDDAKALEFVADTLGKIPRPERKLDQTYTVEPPQDGERFVELRRVGEQKEVMLAYHGPSAAHADSAPLQVLAGIMTGGGGRGGGGQGRLSKALVDSKKANSVAMSFGLQHDPGLIEVSASFSKDQSQEEVRKIMIETLEALVKEAPSNDEVDRAKTRLMRNLENQMSDSETFGRALSAPIAEGDWRLIFLQHDRVKDVTAADVVRVAKTYLKPSNRTTGYFIPDPNPDRTIVPETPQLESLLSNYKTGLIISRGESFDPTPANIEARVTRSKLANGMKVVMLNKQTANATVYAAIELSFGDQQTLAGKNGAAQLAAALLLRGTRTKTRQQFQDAMDKLDARININIGGAAGGGGRGGGGGTTSTISTVNVTVQAPAKNFDAALRLAAEMLREPAYPEADFDQLRTQRVRALENTPTEPAQLAQDTLQRHLSPYAKGDAQYTGTREDQLVAMRKVTLSDVKKFHDQFYGASHGVAALIGPVDRSAVTKTLEETLGSWTAPGPYRRLTAVYKTTEPLNQRIETPDKANAQFEAGLRIQMSQDDPDYPAMVLANYMLGGAITARIPDRIRNREGLSYSVSTSFTAPGEGNAAMFSAAAISNPANTPKVEASFIDELRKALQDGFSPGEIAVAKQAYRDAQLVSRSQDPALLTLLASRERLDRTLLWDQQMDAKIQSLTPEQVNAAFRQRMDLSALSVVKAGDFKAAKVYQQ
ncbi:MAG: insulinase family protein [Bryobacterales bacterium]|nr:insulinase family protein [Bryobacterales bacterium]